MSRIQIRRDTSANWTCVNPVLYEGELAFETDTKILKIGDGASQYNNVSTLSTPDLIDLTSISVCTNTASGNGNLSYNNITGEFAFTPADLSSYAVTGDLSNFICLTDLSLCTNTASGNGNLSYDNITGEFAFTPADIDSYFTNGSISNLYMTGTLCGPSTFIIDPAAHGDNTGTVVIAGNLQIDGTTTTINSTTLEVDDVNITLASGSVNAAASDGAGITVDLGSDGTAAILYDYTNDDWKLNKALQVADSLNVTSAGAPTLTIKTIAGNSYDATLTIAGARTASSTSEIAAIRLRNETSSAYDLARIIAFDPSGNHASGNGMLSFKVSNNGTLEQRLVISNDGNVGIGTSSPATTLTVEGSNKAFPLLYNTGYGNIHIQSNEATATQNFGGVLTFGGLGRTSSPAEKFVFAAIAGRKETTLNGDAKGYLQFGTLLDDTNEIKERMRIDSSGNVGIGTSSPSYALDVSSADSGIRLGSDVAGYRVFRESTGGDGGVLKFFGSQSGYTGYIFSGVDGERMRIDASGNVGIGTSSPTAKLDVNGNIRHTGLAPTSGFNIDQIWTVTKSLQVTTDWIDTGIDSSHITAAGSYMIQMYVDNYDTSGQEFQEYYTGVMSWRGSTNSNATDEIILHSAGHAPNNGRTYLRTRRSYNVDDGKMYLQIKGAVALTAADNYIFNFRRMI